MKIFGIILFVVCTFAFTQTAWGQEANQRVVPGVLGYFDPLTGVFRSLAQPLVEEPDATTPTGGTFSVSFTITVKSAIPTADKISCSVAASVAEVTTGHFFNETATVAATRNGSTATCTVTIPYSWLLTTPTKDSVSLTYVIAAPALPTVTTALPSRTSAGNLATITVPANGKITDETITATI